MLIDVPYADDRFDRGLRAIHRNLVIQARLVADIIDVSRGVNTGLDEERNVVDVTSIVHAAVAPFARAEPPVALRFGCARPAAPPRSSATAAQVSTRRFCRTRSMNSARPTSR